LTTCEAGQCFAYDAAERDCRTRVVAVDDEVAREAARIRATSGVGMPEALLVASALAAGATVIVTNDGRWPGAIDRLGLALTVVEPAAFVDRGAA
jgi:predicted nucleic acid-binding protein